MSMKRSFFMIFIFALFFLISCNDDKKSDTDDDNAVTDVEVADEDITVASGDCVDGEDKVVFCGKDSDGLQKMICTNGEWETDGECITRTSCSEGETKIVRCGTNSDGMQNMICTDGKWVDDGSCVIEECKSGTKLVACGENNEGLQQMKCEDGSWVNDGDCVLPTECKTGEEKVVVCGDNSNGLQRVICTDGSWADDGDCMIDTECEEGEQRVVECGANGEKFITLVCDSGKWSEDGDCEAISCTDGEKREVACGYNYTGIQSKLCENNNWIDDGGCITGEKLSGTVYIKRKTTKDATNDVTQVEDYSYHVVDGHLIPATYKRSLPIAWMNGSWLPELYNVYNVKGELIQNTTSFLDDYIYELGAYDETETREFVWDENGAYNDFLNESVESDILYGNLTNYDYVERTLERDRSLESHYEFSDYYTKSSFNQATQIFYREHGTAENGKRHYSRNEYKFRTTPPPSSMSASTLEYSLNESKQEDGQSFTKTDFVAYTTEQYHSNSKGSRRILTTFNKEIPWKKSAKTKVECASDGNLFCFTDNDGVQYQNLLETWTYDAQHHLMLYRKTAQYDVDGDGTDDTVEFVKQVYENGRIKSLRTKYLRHFRENTYDADYLPYTSINDVPGSYISTNGQIHYEEWSYDDQGRIIRKVGKLNESDATPLYETTWTNSVTDGVLTQVLYRNSSGREWTWKYTEAPDGWTDVVMTEDLATKNDVPNPVFRSHYIYKVKTEGDVEIRSYRKYNTVDVSDFVEWREQEYDKFDILTKYTSKYEDGKNKLVTILDTTSPYATWNGTQIYYDIDGTKELQRLEYGFSGQKTRIFCQGRGCTDSGFSESSSHFRLGGVQQQYWNEVISYNPQGFETGRVITAGADEATAVVVEEYQYTYSIHHKKLTTKEMLNYPGCYDDERIWNTDSSDWINPHVQSYLAERSFDIHGNQIAYKRTIKYDGDKEAVLEELTANADGPKSYFCDFRGCNMDKTTRECSDFSGNDDRNSPCNYSKTLWTYDGEKLTHVTHSDYADKVWRETNIEWQTVDSKDVHKKFERFYAGNTVEKRIYNDNGNIIEDYFNDKEAMLGKLHSEMDFHHRKYTYDDKEGLLKEESFDRGEVLVDWFDYLNSYSSNIVEGKDVLVNAVKLDSMGNVVESYDYQYDAVD